MKSTRSQLLLSWGTPFCVAQVRREKRYRIPSRKSDNGNESKGTKKGLSQLLSPETQALYLKACVFQTGCHCISSYKHNSNNNNNNNNNNHKNNKYRSFNTRHNRKTCNILVCQCAFLATLRGIIELVLVLDVFRRRLKSIHSDL